MPSPDRSSQPVQTGHVAVYPGSFDPMTFGHLDVVSRARRLFDRVIVAIGHNPGKESLFTIQERLAMARELVGGLNAGEPGLPPAEVATFTGLTMDFARRSGATFTGLTMDFARRSGASVLLRGIRNLPDLQYEVQQAMTNREVAGLDTVLMVAGPSFAYISASLIRQIAAMGDDMEKLSTMVPPAVVAGLERKKSQRHPALTRLIADMDPSVEID